VNVLATQLNVCIINFAWKIGFVLWLGFRRLFLTKIAKEISRRLAHPKGMLNQWSPTGHSCVPQWRGFAENIPMAASGLLLDNLCFDMEAVVGGVHGVD